MTIWEHTPEEKLKKVERKINDLAVESSDEAMGEPNNFYKLGYAKAMSDSRSTLLGILYEGGAEWKES